MQALQRYNNRPYSPIYVPMNTIRNVCYIAKYNVQLKIKLSCFIVRNTNRNDLTNFVRSAGGALNVDTSAIERSASQLDPVRRLKIPAPK